MTKNFYIRIMQLSFIFASYTVFSQTVQQQWVRSYNGSRSIADMPSAMAVDRFGNVYVTGAANHFGCLFGCSFSTEFADEDYITIKYNAAGVQQWAVRYNGTANEQDMSNAVAVDFSGNVYVTGISLEGNSNPNITTIKYNTSGVQQWIASYDGAQNLEQGNAIALDAAGNVYVTGFKSTDPSNVNTTDIVTIKYNASGVQQWASSFDGPSNSDQPKNIAVDLLGNVYVGGRSIITTATIEIPGPGSTTAGVVLKYDPQGNLLWVNRTSGEVNDMAIDAVGNVYVTDNKFTANSDYETIKYNTNGVLQWDAQYNGAANKSDQSAAIALDLLGNVYVTGFSVNEHNTADYATVKYDANGVQQWVAIYNGPADKDDLPQDVGADIFGNIYVTGRSQNAASDNAYLTVKYNASGLKQWEARYDAVPASAFDDEAIALGLSNPGGILSSLLFFGTNIYVTGWTTQPGTGLDITTIRYTQKLVFNLPFFTTVGEAPAAPVSLDRSNSYKLSNSPNPFSTATKIMYEVPADAHVSIRIYDGLGREIAALVNRAQKPGSYTADFYRGRLPGGIYYCTAIYDFGKNRSIQTKPIIISRE